MTFARIALALAAPFLLTGCLLAPGKFVSDLTLLKDGTFAFTYKGEIQSLAMSGLMSGAMAAEEASFEAQCYDDEGESRECSPDEAAEQAAAKAVENAQTEAMMAALMPGLDAGDEESVERFTEQLARMKGWNAVTYQDDGIFEVDVRIEGRSDRSFVFPVVEDMPLIAPFVAMVVRSDGRIRVQASGFKTDPQSGNMGALAAMGSGSGAEMDEGTESAAPQRMVKLDGTFTVRTDGEILTNNTDEGARSEGGLRVLEWRVLPDRTTAPETLIQL
jgi:hypothetical protein